MVNPIKIPTSTEAFMTPIRRSTNAPPRRTAGRRRSRGAVHIEALIGIGLTIGVLIAGLYTHRVHRTKLRVANEARTSAWMHALGGCNQKQPGGADVLGSAADGMAREEPEMPEDALTGPIVVTSEPRSSEEGVPGIAHFSGLQVSASSTVLCNEKPAEAQGIQGFMGKFFESPF
jgi:hypothetical protein